MIKSSQQCVLPPRVGDDRQPALPRPTRPQWLAAAEVLLVAWVTFAMGCSSEPKPDQTQARQSTKIDEPVDQATVPTPSVETASPTKDKPVDRAVQLQHGDQLIAQGKYQEAIDCFQRVLIAEPDDVHALFRIANAHASAQQLDRAIEVINEIPEDHPQAGMAAIGQAADWYMQSGDYAKAEQKYRKVLQAAPDFAMAHRNLAFLLNRQGRRHEAAKHIQTLCLLGNVRQDELHSLALISDAIADDDESQDPHPTLRRYTPIGGMGEARVLFANGQFADAADRIEEQVRSGTAPASVLAFYGRAVAEAQDNQRFAWWTTQVSEESRGFSEYWAAIAVELINQGDFRPACRALIEAIDRDPTDIRSIMRLQTALATLGHQDWSDAFDQRWHQTRELVNANNAVANSDQTDPELVARLADLLDKAGRQIEAVMWRSIEWQARNAAPTKMNELNRQRLQLRKNGQGFPDQATRLENISPTDFPIPTLAQIKLSPSEPLIQNDASPPPISPATFANIAKEIGLKHEYKMSTQRQRDGFTVYQTAGGGVAALDFDRDGWVDFVFAQGDADPPEFVTQSTNQIYRNVSAKLKLVSNEAALSDRQYTLGVTAGDWNQDGFLDLAFANIGQNTLWINNGDGTFRQQTLPNEIDLTLMPSSLAIADVNSDQLPDLVEINYAHDPSIVDYPARNEQGRVKQSLSPLSYVGGQDRILLNTPSGQPIATRLEKSAGLLGYGVIVADVTDDPGNEIFIGNDLHPNQLWVQQPNQDRWIDIATTSGCAFAFSGAATASMGIAAGDFDGNGELDFHITNFQDQAASLFLGQNGVFRDRYVWMNLAKDSSEVLGFGTQAIDYDNDSQIDLVVTNGNIEDSVEFPRPFEQPNQLFANRQNRFELATVTDPTGYWSKKHLGRALANVDFNRDGKMDFVITHLNEPSALLINQTKTPNHFLQIELVATDDARDAIGTKITVLIDDSEQTDWRIAGSGYLSSNEPMVAFGLAQNDVIDTLHIDWPNQTRETFRDIPADSRILVTQGQGEIFFVQP